MRSPRAIVALLIFAMSTLAGVYFAWQLAVGASRSAAVSSSPGETPADCGRDGRSP